MKVVADQTIRDLLQKELARRCAENPRYSLRAFSRALGMSHATVSQVISGKRPLSRKALRKIQDHLGFAPSAPSFAYEQISLDRFSLIADWYHYGILSLLETPRARIEPQYIARRLGISVAEAKAALSRLRRLDLIHSVGGRWRQKGGRIRVDNTVASPAARKFHTQLLAMAKASLENDPMPIRDFTGITLAFDPAQMAYATRKLNELSRELAVDLQNRGRPTEVYELAIQFFPVSKQGE